MKKIIILANLLSKFGLNSEASFVYRLSKKGMPLKGFVSIHSQEPTMHGPYKDQNLERNPYIQKDEYNRQKTTSYYDEDSFEAEEAKYFELSQWYHYLRMIGDSIILIPFDASDIEGNIGILYGLCDIFGVNKEELDNKDLSSGFPKEAKKYQKLVRKVCLSNKSGRHIGNLEILKTRFPALWADISDLLTQNNMDQSDAVYMLYNQQTNPLINNVFTKDPFYLAHDLGHAISDVPDIESEAFYNKETFTYFYRLIFNFMENILSLYTIDIDSDNEDIKELSEMNVYDLLWNDQFRDRDRRDTCSPYIRNFFFTVSNTGDQFQDIFAETAAGELIINIPENIRVYYNGKQLIAYLSDMGKAEQIKNNTISDMKNFINPGYEEGIYEEGPLKKYRGKVVLLDI